MGKVDLRSNYRALLLGRGEPVNVLVKGSSDSSVWMSGLRPQGSNQSVGSRKRGLNW